MGVPDRLRPRRIQMGRVRLVGRLPETVRLTEVTDHVRGVLVGLRVPILLVRRTRLLQERANVSHGDLWASCQPESCPDPRPYHRHENTEDNYHERHK